MQTHNFNERFILKCLTRLGLLMVIAILIYQLPALILAIKA